ncbi:MULTISPECIES: AbrB/MazE/SpoVT family DNA-binding domain-containing protein [unclassified Okeania]|uniref:AbrB/MazE/SpoVT family DNA-binding domain-containing protein n=1 Tax=unclassified Okeania TaxID=2634635 RepID=UPI0013B5FC14|nr:MULTISPECIES: AbrB/MazE/SpoVT family DNA-binding domain-containing protein [unclassified Okeania]NES74548.1 AbrB/MazE/SpoVT family DNA-binding domain-containing protein [Okeania sp. SIO1H4]NES89804.1 AbrB/MazE/SpoVT family DNA-binding domain-containing protein [Okeania sp. SIO2B9]NET20847.1 AbrB/MazE/SpoVT family DNA-binding domain-containing protein [Okeania sp. SIO1H5]NET74727.1 AbrB/MazE/SpoVT family DNA-binding domain-containing protein [Okeania sp. SIO1F9]NET94084.1 AbrB/MazE/SpoVT fam
MTTTKLGEEYKIVIPPEVRDTLKWQPGDRLELKIVDDTIVIVPEMSYTSRLFGKHRQLWQDEDAINYIRSQRE